MTHDSGFAPNPYFDLCTLAACTPNHMRSRADIEDVIVGVESDALITKRTLKGIGDDRRRVVYWMRITKRMTLDQYYRDPKFDKKKYRAGSYAERCGDNVYFLDDKQERSFLPGHAHDNDQKLFDQDWNGDRVFISNDYYYFGSMGMPIPPEFECMYPAGQGIKYPENSVLIDDALIKEFDNKVFQYADNLGGNGMLGHPIEAELSSDGTSLTSCGKGVKAARSCISSLGDKKN